MPDLIDILNRDVFRARVILNNEGFLRELVDSIISGSFDKSRVLFSDLAARIHTDMTGDSPPLTVSREANLNALELLNDILKGSSNVIPLNTKDLIERPISSLPKLTRIPTFDYRIFGEIDQLSRGR